MVDNKTSSSQNMALTTTVKQGHKRKCEYSLPDIKSQTINYEMLTFNEPLRNDVIKSSVHQTIIKVGEILKNKQIKENCDEKEQLVLETKETMFEENEIKNRIRIKRAIQKVKSEHKKHVKQLNNESKVALKLEMQKVMKEDKIMYETALEDEIISIEDAYKCRIEQMKIDWLVTKNRHIENIVREEKARYGIIEKELIQALRNKHETAMDKVKDERKTAILSLKDSLVKEHHIQVQLVQKRCETSAQQILLAKKDFYDQQLAILRSRVSEREDAMDDLREMISAMTLENKSLRKSLRDVRSEYYHFVKTTIPSDNATDFILPHHFNHK